MKWTHVLASLAVVTMGVVFWREISQNSLRTPPSARTRSVSSRSMSGKKAFPRAGAGISRGNNWRVGSYEQMMDAENPQSSVTAQSDLMRGKYHSDVYFNEQDYYPLRKMQQGVRKLACVVGATLGPKGRNIVVQRKVGARPRIINDGVTIAKEVSLEDDLEEIGCQLVREASERSNVEAGDGTTSAIVLSDAIITEGIKRVVSGVNAMQIYRGLSEASEKLMQYLEDEVAIQVEDHMITDVATISAGGDLGIGSMIGRAMKEVGRLGLIILEEGKNVEDEIEVQYGMFIDECGYINNKLINTPEDGTVKYQDPKVVIVDGEINSLEEIIPIMELGFESDWPILIIAHSFSKEVENFLVLNHQRAGLKVAAVNAPAFGEMRSSVLEDIAILTGGKVLGEETDDGVSLQEAKIEHLGDAELVEVGKDGCLISPRNDTAEAVNARVEQLETLKELKVDAGEPKFELDKINRRIAKLQGGVSVIYVGAMTELELRDRKLRYDDALCAIRAALDEGIVPGGATSFLRLAKKLDDIIPTLKPEEQKGGEILQKALEYPLLMVARNAGSWGPLIVEDVKEGQKSDSRFGWNAATDKYGDLIDMGVIEPAKVIRCVVENAVSVAKTFLLVEGVVIQHDLGPQKKDADYGQLTM
ncbi:hypothetical protein AAMO2058_001646700 [Amorphochlora amoebiformis]